MKMRKLILSMNTILRLRNHYLQLLALLCLTLGTLGAMAQTTTVYNGTDKNRYFPLYAYFADDAQHTQFVMPASDLSDLNGKNITAITFYHDGNSDWTSTGTFTMKLNNSINSTSIGTNFINTSTWTTYFTGTVTCNSNGTMTITLSTPLTYNSSRPLWIDFQLPVDDENYNNIYFYGQNKSGATGLYYNRTYIIYRRVVAIKTATIFLILFKAT